MSYWKQQRGFLIVMAAITLVIGGLYVHMFSAGPSTAFAAATVEMRAANPEQVMMFKSGVDGTHQLQEDVNKWLKDHDGKMEITGRTQSGDRYVTTITIWYKIKTD